MTAEYLMAGQASELERLQLQSRVWEPSGRAHLAQLPSGAGLRVVDVGCGALGWLRILSEWVGPSGSVVGTDINREMLAAARSFVDSEALTNVELVEDDLFASALPAGSFDLVHARFQLAPIGRAPEQLASYRRLIRPAGWLVLEEPDAASWRFNPPAQASERLIGLVIDAFRAGEKDAAEFWIEMSGRFLHIRYFALRDAQGGYRGVVETVQDVTEIRALQGQRRLVDW